MYLDNIFIDEINRVGIYHLCQSEVDNHTYKSMQDCLNAKDYKIKYQDDNEVKNDCQKAKTFEKTVEIKGDNKSTHTKKIVITAITFFILGIIISKNV